MLVFKSIDRRKIMSEKKPAENVSPEDLPVDVKMRFIENSDSLEALKRVNTGYLPPVPLVKPDLYYFVSYSHKDYKKVYSDIFALQARGVNIWYDRGMRAGSDWKEVADEYITPSKCAGVIFYISENSLGSDAIHTEIEYAAKCGKSCLTINLPLESDFSVEGKNMRGEEVSAKALLDILKANGKAVSGDKYESISRAFGDDVIYVKYSSSAEEKVEKILSMKRPPLIEAEFSLVSDLPSFKIISVNDHDIKKFDEGDYFKVNVIGEKNYGYELFNIDQIASCAFANCKRLESVCIPEHIDTIAPYTFHGCNSLKRIYFSNESKYNSIYEIGDGAFYDCFALEEIDLNDVCEPIGREAFYRCKSLKKVEIGDDTREIKEAAFAHCGNLERVKLSAGLELISASAFRYCKSLKSIEFPEALAEIGEYAFAGCESLTRLTVPETLKKIGSSAFSDCTSLKKVEIKGECELSIWAFANCGKLEEITFAAVPKEIGGRTFLNCKKLKKIDLTGAKFIFESAFEGCESLEEVHLSSELEVLIGNCFSGCKKLKHIYYGGTKEQWDNLAWTDEQRRKYTEGGGLLGVYKFIPSTAEDMIPSRAAEPPEPFDKFQYLGLGNAPTVIHCTDGDIVNPEYLVSETERRLEKLGAKKGMKFGTKITRALLNALGSPDDKLKIIHVAGTNGKGTVSLYIQNILVENGISAGTFTTPAVYDYRECFRINGRKIPRDLLVECFNAVFALEESKNATRFEIETAAAIYAFYLSGCEYAILECGMGGLNDATNAVNKKELAVITSVSLEHTKYLGETVEEICAQKAGIIKDCPAIVSAYNSEEVKTYFKNLGATVTDEPSVSDAVRMGSFKYGGGRYMLAPYSAANACNAVLALRAAELIGIDSEALKRSRFVYYSAGRLQLTSCGSKQYLLDGAHNPAAFEPLAEFLRGYCKTGDWQPTIIYGCLSDKDIGGCLDKLKGLTESVIAVQPPSPRAMGIEKIYSECAKRFQNVKSAESVSGALDMAEGNLVVVCGSFTILKEASVWIGKKQ